MTANLLDVLFGCWHKTLSFPISSKPGTRRPAAAALTGTYVVCLDCGREFPYDWQEMKVIEAEPHHGQTLAGSSAESFASK